VAAGDEWSRTEGEEEYGRGGYWSHERVVTFLVGAVALPAASPIVAVSW
jgi:hypothetical protein